MGVDADIGVCNVNVKPRAAQPEKDKNDDVLDDTDAVAINCEEPVSASFALRYLNFFTKATPLASSITIQLDDDKPLIIEYELNDGEKDDKPQDCGFLRFFLAHKIDE